MGGGIWTRQAVCAMVRGMDQTIGPDSPQLDGVESGLPHTRHIERGALPEGALWA